MEEERGVPHVLRPPPPPDSSFFCGFSLQDGPSCQAVPWASTELREMEQIDQLQVILALKRALKNLCIISFN